MPHNEGCERSNLEGLLLHLLPNAEALIEMARAGI
jgi:hypothetical protein